jgi:hypothetical protein
VDWWIARKIPNGGDRVVNTSEKKKEFGLHEGFNEIANIRNNLMVIGVELGIRLSSSEKKGIEDRLLGLQIEPTFFIETSICS